MREEAPLAAEGAVESRLAAILHQGMTDGDNHQGPKNCQMDYDHPRHRDRRGEYSGSELSDMSRHDEE